MSTEPETTTAGHGVDHETIAAWRRRRAPAGLEARVQAQLDARARWRPRPWLRPALAGAAACLLAIAGLWLHDKGPGTGAPVAGSYPGGAAVDRRLAGPPSLAGLGPMPTASGQPPLAGGPLPSLLDLPAVDLSPRRAPSRASSPKEDS